MVTAEDVGVDPGTLETRAQDAVHVFAVQAPSDIFFANPGPVTPPGVLPGVLAKFPKGIHKVFGQKLIHPGSFFGKKSRRLGVGLRVGQIDFFVSDINISTKNETFLLFGERPAQLHYNIAKLELITEAGMISPAVGEITINQSEGAKVGDKGSSFGVEFFDPQPFFDR